MENKEETIIDGQKEKMGVKKENTKKNGKTKEVLKNVGFGVGGAAAAAAFMGATIKPEDVEDSPVEPETETVPEKDVPVQHRPAAKHESHDTTDNAHDDEPITAQISEDQINDIKDDLTAQIREELKSDEAFRDEVKEDLKEDLMNDEDFRNEIIAEVKKDLVNRHSENVEDTDEITVSINPDDDDVEIVDTGYMPTEEGGEIPYAVLDSGGTAVGVFDTTGNGNVDMVVIDVNNNLTIDEEDSFIDVSKREIPMSNYCQTEEPVDENLLVDNIGGDFNNDADISDLAMA